MASSERKQRERAERERAIIGSARSIAEAEGWEAVTTRRLAAEIEYSQPVLYEHFRNRGAIVDAAALEGFEELAEALTEAREDATDAVDALARVAFAYCFFAESAPALYEAMFLRRTSLPFAREESAEPLKTAFDQFLLAVTPLAGDRDPGLLAETVWSALHGLSTLDRGGRLSPDGQAERLQLLVSLVAGTSSTT